MIKPYSKNNEAILWCDPYISMKMLEYNLQADNDIVSRNLNDIKKSVKFITNKYLHKGSTLCDLGCGAGLYTNLFQKQGIKVTGIDISTKAIEYARTQNKKVEYINADYLNINIKKKFDFVTMIYCDFGLLTQDDRGVLLENVKSMLNEDGLFMFDVWNYKFYEEVPPINAKYIEQDGFYMQGKSKVKKVNYKYDNLHLILTKTIVKGQHNKLEVYLWDKFFNIDEITSLLNEHGLEIVNLYGNAHGGRYKEEEYCITVVCKATKK